MKLGIDLMGSDSGYAVIIQGISDFYKDQNSNRKITDLILYGTEEAIKKAKQELPELLGENLVTSEGFISADDSALAFRKKPKASVCLMINDINEGKISTGFSACNTKAYIAVASIFIGKKHNTSKVAIASTLPRSDGSEFFFLDAGAKVNYTPEDFVTITHYGIQGAKALLNRENPTVRMVNIGEEDGKGDTIHIEASKLLRENFPNNYLGNVEPHKFMTHDVDVVITDGFAGNMVAKAFEGGVELSMNLLKEIAGKNLLNKLALGIIKKDIKKEVFRYDYRSKGSAIIFGLKKIVLKAHGRSDAVAIKNGIRNAYSIIEMDLENKIEF